MKPEVPASTRDEALFHCTTPRGVPRARAEGLLFLHGLESNPGSSLQTEEEAGLPVPAAGREQPASHDAHPACPGRPRATPEHLRAPAGFRALAGCSRHGKGLDARRAGRESLPLHAPGDVPRQQAGLERGWLGRDAWREVRCPTQAECPGCQVPEVRGRCRDEGAEVCDGSAASQPPAAQPGAAWGPVTCQGTRIQGPQPLGGQVCPETGSVSVQPREGEQAQPDRPPLPRKCGCDSGKASCGRRQVSGLQRTAGNWRVSGLWQTKGNWQTGGN